MFLLPQSEDMLHNYMCFMIKQPQEEKDINNLGHTKGNVQNTSELSLRVTSGCRSPSRSKETMNVRKR